MLSDNEQSIPITEKEFPLLVLQKLKSENEQLIRLVEARSNLWRTPPFFHEAWLLQVFVYLLEKGEENITEDDAGKISLLLQHITKLTNKQIMAEKPEKRTIPPLLNEQLRDEMRIISEQIDEGAYIKKIIGKDILSVFLEVFITT